MPTEGCSEASIEQAEASEGHGDELAFVGVDLLKGCDHPDGVDEEGCDDSAGDKCGVERSNGDQR